MRNFHYNILELIKSDGGLYNVSTLDSAYKFCKQITVSHYENFPVASLFVPHRLRKHIYPIYAFARLADDVADENFNLSNDIKNEYLSRIELQLFNYSTNGNPVFWALLETISEAKLPKELFQKLLIAFKRDANFKQPETIDELFDYCTYSANPVGEIILRLFELYNDKTILYSDSICTGLQLANFWQDLSVDYSKNRIYIPKDFLARYGILNLFDNKNSIKLKLLLDELYNLTENLLIKGYKLLSYLNPVGFKIEMALTINAGRKLIAKLRKAGNEILQTQFRLKKIDYINIFFSTLMKI